MNELLQQCTVKLSVPDNGQVGTGFFIAPGYILTCEHVVRGAVTAIVDYKNKQDYATATVEQVFAEKDIALLRFEPPEALPCVLLSTDVPKVGDQISTFGYPANRYDPDGTPWKGIPALLTMEGTTGDEPAYLQLSLGNVLPGMSGGALLHRGTGQVCGMLKFTRDETSLMGGGGVLGRTIAECIPEILEAQRQFHQLDGRWQELLPETGQTDPLSIHQTVDGNQNIVVGSTSGDTTIIGRQTIETILPTPSPDVTGIPSNLQERGSRTFVGRDKTLEELHEKLQTSQTLAITALQGMGGIGKTEMAVQYAQQYKTHYPSGGCWLSARGAEVGTQLVNFAVTVLGLPQPEGELVDQVRYVWSRWPRQDAGERVLLIYDDVADYGDIDGLLPTDGRFQVLLTTRLQNLAAGVDDFRLDLLSKGASLELLRQIVDGGGTTRIDAELAIAEALCERVGYLPLGLELLGYFLKNKPDMSLERLAQRLERKKLEAKAFKQTQAGMTAKLGVYEAFELSWEELSEEGQGLACWLSVFGLAPMPWGLVVAAVEGDDRDELEDVRDEELLKLSLVQRLGAGSYQLHQLVREFFLAKLEERKDRKELKTGYCGLMVGLAKQIGQSATQEVTQAMTPAVPHIAEVINRWADSLSDEDFIWPFSGLTMFYYAQGIYDGAIGWAAQATIATEERFGAEHPSVATSLNNLAALYESQGRYEDAEPLYVAALEMMKKLLGAEHPSVATSLNNLAELYRSQGRYEDAEPLYVAALEMMKKLLGAEHPDVATSLNNLAGLYESQGRYEDAEPLYVAALEMRKKLLGAEHPDVATSLNNLAGLYRSQGRYEDAEPLYVAALEMRKKLLGAEHPDVATSLNNLAVLFYYQNRYADAESYLLKAFELRNRLLGQQHPHTQGTWNSYLHLLRTVIQNNQTGTLSDHPITQDLIPKIRAAMERQGE